MKNIDKHDYVLKLRDKKSRLEDKIWKMENSIEEIEAEIAKALVPELPADIIGKFIKSDDGLVYIRIDDYSVEPNSDGYGNLWLTGFGVRFSGNLHSDSDVLTLAQFGKDVAVMCPYNMYNEDDSDWMKIVYINEEEFMEKIDKTVSMIMEYKDKKCDDLNFMVYGK